MKYIIFDLEATCSDTDNKFEMETIEIGGIVFAEKYPKSLEYIWDSEEELQFITKTLSPIMPEELEIIGKLDEFVKPVINPILTDFCKNLTHITQEQVDSAKIFPSAIEELTVMLDSEFGEDYRLCSWGFYDRKQLTHDCNYHHLSTDWLKKHISIKHQYGKIKGIKPCGIKKALNRENERFTGIHHRADSDALNISKIFLKYFDKWEI